MYTSKKAVPHADATPRARTLPWMGGGCAAGLLALATVSRDAGRLPGSLPRHGVARAPHPRRGARGGGRLGDRPADGGRRVQRAARRARQARRALARAVYADRARARAHAVRARRILRAGGRVEPAERLDRPGGHGGRARGDLRADDRRRRGQHAGVQRDGGAPDRRQRRQPGGARARGARRRPSARPARRVPRGVLRERTLHVRRARAPRPLRVAAADARRLRVAGDAVRDRPVPRALASGPHGGQRVDGVAPVDAGDGRATARAPRAADARGLGRRAPGPSGRGRRRGARQRVVPHVGEEVRRSRGRRPSSARLSAERT